MSNTTLKVKIYGATAAPSDNSYKKEDDVAPSGDNEKKHEEEGKQDQEKQDSTPSIPETNTSTDESGQNNPSATSADTGFFTPENTTNSSQIDFTPFSFIAFILFILALVFTIFLPKLQKRLSHSSSRYTLKPKNSNKLRLGSLIFASFSLLVGIVSTVFATRHAYEVESSPVVLLDAKILETDHIALAHDTITVENAPDLKLYITADSPDLSDYFTNNKTEPNKIPSLETKGPLVDNSYGVYIGKEQPTASSEFYPIYTTPDNNNYLVSLADEPAVEGETRTIDVWYGVKTKNAITSIYTVNLKIEALGNEESPEPEPVDIFSMQSMTPEICQSLAVGEEYTLTDNRDNKSYRIAKLEDGNCWMLDNLDLELVAPNAENPNGGTRRTNPDTGLEEIIALDASNTNVTDVFKPSITTSNDPDEVWDYGDLLGNPSESCLTEENLCADKTYSFDPEPNSSESGTIYNLIAASAGTVKTDLSVLEINPEPDYIPLTRASASICPKGWILAETDSYLSLFAAHSLELFARIEINDSDVVRYEQTIPNFTNTYSGLYEPIFGAFGKLGYISEIDFGGLIAYFPTFQSDPAGQIISRSKSKSDSENTHNDSFQALTSDYMVGKAMGAFLGGAVRCIADFKTSKITFSENTSDSVSNMPQDIERHFSSDTISRATTITFPEQTPTRTGYIFAGWSLKPERDDTLYYPGYTRTLASPNPTIYATWLKAAPVPTMQDLTQEVCTNLTIDETYGLKDSRDGKVYKIARMRDGKCWMTQNLALDPETTLNPNTSNVDSEWTLPASFDGDEDEEEGVAAWVSDTEPRMYKEPRPGTSAADGNWYNWTAAIAKDDSSTFAYEEKDATTSICPKGWHLPAGGENENKNEFSLLLSAYDPAQFFNEPLFFSLSGYYKPGFEDRNYESYFWSSTSEYNTTYLLSIRDNRSSSTSGHGARRNGYSVRCVFGNHPSTLSTTSSNTNLIDASPNSQNSLGPSSANNYGSNSWLGNWNQENEEETTGKEDHENENETENSDKTKPLGVTKQQKQEKDFDLISVIVITISVLLIILGLTAIYFIEKKDKEED